MSLDDLKALQRDVAKAISNFETRKWTEALAAIDAIARSMGFVPHDLLGTRPPRKPVAAKYANPANPSETWSGRGRRPVWFAAALEAGKSAEDLAIRPLRRWVISALSLDAR
jgi:DNA-binding protein H-NS